MIRISRDFFTRQKSREEFEKSHPQMSNSKSGDCISNLRGYFSQEVNDIIFWNKKYVSMLTLILINATYSLVQFGFYSVISLLCYSLIVVLMISFIVHKKASIKALGSPDDVNKLNSVADSLRLSEEKLKSFTSLVSHYYVRGEDIIFTAMKNENPVFALKVVGALFVIAQLANYVSPLTLLWLGGNWFLTWPAIYSQKKETIDSKYNYAKEVFLKKADPLLKKLPNNVTQLDASNIASADSDDEIEEDRQPEDLFQKRRPICYGNIPAHLMQGLHKYLSRL